MEEFITKSNSGFVAKNNTECLRILRSCIKNKQDGNSIEYHPNHNYASQFSRQEQTRKLAKLINEHC